MLVTYLRSSSATTLDFCEHKYALSYVLGFKETSGFAADKGNVFHKAMECLALAKFAQQKGETEFDGEDLGIISVTDGLDPVRMLDLAFDHYVKITPHHGKKWDAKTRKECHSWVDKILAWSNGHFDPRNQDIIQPELKFDFTINEPWAEYSYQYGNETIAGMFALKGTVDLVSRIDDYTIEITDYKTGSRMWDWAKDKEKKYDDLKHDIQLRMYHYVVKKLFPQYHHVITTIMYVANKGPSTVDLCDDDLPETEQMIKTYFERIQRVVKPKLHKTWKCKAFCHFGKTKQPGTDKTMCEFFESEVKTKTLYNVSLEYGSAAAFTEYGDGGGRRTD